MSACVFIRFDHHKVRNCSFRNKKKNYLPEMNQFIIPKYIHIPFLRLIFWIRGMNILLPTEEVLIWANLKKLPCFIIIKHYQNYVPVSIPCIMDGRRKMLSLRINNLDFTTLLMLKLNPTLWGRFKHVICLLISKRLNAHLILLYVELVGEAVFLMIFMLPGN